MSGFHLLGGAPARIGALVGGLLLGCAAAPAQDDPRLVAANADYAKCDAAGDVDGAIDAAGVFERRLGADHHRTGFCLGNLASTLVDLGRFDEAEPLLARAVAIEEKVSGADDPRTRALKAKLAEVRARLGAGAKGGAVRRRDGR